MINVDGGLLNGIYSRYVGSEVCRVNGLKLIAKRGKVVLCFNGYFNLWIG